MMDYDYVLVGGGLQNALIALALGARRRQVRLALVERDASLGGNHTWSFHEGDVPASLLPVVAPLGCHRWPAYDVAFPDHTRRIVQPYTTITSERLDAVLRGGLAGLGADVLLGHTATRVAPGRVELADGRVLVGRVVIDARGPSLDAPLAIGYQKFVGVELELGRPTTLDVPRLMDARVAQIGGLRFLYVLPFSPRRVLVEDTVYADGPALDRPALRAGALAYAATLGLDVVRVVREEQGVLPLPGAVSEAAPLVGARGGWLLTAGYGGGWMHPTTGHSLPVALRLAAHVAARTPFALDDGFAALHAAHRRQLRFACRLNRLLFRHFAPDERWHVLARFYRLPTDAVARFYALDTTAADRLRILCGRPPGGMRLVPRRRLQVAL